MGVFADIEQGNTARSLCFVSVAYNRHGFVEDRYLKIVEHNAGDTAYFDDFLEFHQIAHFDGDIQVKSFFFFVGMGAFDGIAHSARGVHVVVLDHDPIVEAPAVIFAAANLDCPFFQHPDKRGGLAGIQHFYGQVADFKSESAAEGGNAAHALHGIQNQSLALQNCPGIGFNFKSRLAIQHIRAILFMHHNLGTGIQVLENMLGEFNPRQDTIILDFQHCMTATIRRDRGE